MHEYTFILYSMTIGISMFKKKKKQHIRKLKNSSILKNNSFVALTLGFISPEAVGQL